MTFERQELAPNTELFGSDFEQYSMCSIRQQVISICESEVNFKISLSFYQIKMSGLSSMLQSVLPPSEAYSLPWREMFPGLVTAFAVAPSNAIFDKAIIDHANGKTSVLTGIKNGFRMLFKEPKNFFTSFKFRWMYLVCSMTYMTNNLSDQIPWINGVSISIQNLLATFTVYSIVGILKDRAYTQHFGAVSTKAFPRKSLALFFMRDLITIGATFSYPSVLAKWLQESYSFSEHGSKVVAQLACPVLVQLIATPLHLLGLDLYNREGEKSWSRTRKVGSQYPKIVGIRMLRFLPAYGIGGVLNAELRKYLRD